MLSFAAHSGKMGSGDAVLTDTDASPWVMIVPDSVEAALIKMACGIGWLVKTRYIERQRASDTFSVVCEKANPICGRQSFKTNCIRSQAIGDFFGLINLSSPERQCDDEFSQCFD